MKKLLLLLLTGTCLLAGCSGNTSKLERIQKNGQISIFTNAEFQPYAFIQNNEIVGVDIEIGKAIADRLGVKMDLSNATFDGIVASIASGKGDLAIAGITVRPDRQESVDFSIPYVDSVQYIILPQGSDIKVLEDLAGLTVGAQAGTTGAMLVQDEIDKGVLLGLGSAVNEYASPVSAMQDLIVGRISAVVIDELVAISIANANDGYVAIPFIYDSGSAVTEQFAVAIQKGNEDLLKIVNEVIQDMLDKNLIEQYANDFSS